MKQIYFANRHECSPEIHFQKYLDPPTQFQRSHPFDFDHPQSQLSKSMGYGKHDISKSINIEDSIFRMEKYW